MLRGNPYEKVGRYVVGLEISGMLGYCRTMYGSHVCLGGVLDASAYFTVKQRPVRNGKVELGEL